MIKPSLFILAFAIMTLSCKKTTVECDGPATIVKTDTLLISDTIYIDTTSNGCRVLVSKNGSTSGKKYNWVFLVRADQDSAHSSPASYFWLTSARNEISPCDSMAFVSIQDTAYTSVFPNIQLDIPTSFSPNADGINDLFAPVFNGNYYSFELNIYNRWGDVVFNSKDPKLAWDGNFNGQPMSSGTYLIKCSAIFFGLSDNIIYKYERNSALSLLR